MFKYQFRWDTVWGSFDFLMSGLQMTLIISAITLVLAMIGGLIIALLDMSRFRALRWIGISIGEVVRNTPILVQLLWVYYVLPIVFSVRIEALVALIIGLALYQAAFISEVYRSGIQSVPKGHREAAQVLGLSPAAVVPPHRAAAGGAHDPAAARLQLRAAHQILLAGRGDLGERDHAARHGARRHQLPAAGNLHLHRRGLFPHLLAARHGDPLVGTPAAEPLMSTPPFATSLPAGSTPRASA